MRPELEPGEELLWEGRPAQGMRVGVEVIATGIFATIVTAAGFGLGALMQSVDVAPMWLVGVGGLLLGLAIMVGFLAYDISLRKRTYYYLTNRRAFIIEPIRSNRVTEDRGGWRLSDPDTVEFRPGNPGSVIFAKRADRNSSAGPGRITLDVGFKLIDDAEEVADMVRAMARANGIQR